MAYVQVNVQSPARYRQVYFIKEMKDVKLEKTLDLEWYDNSDRKGEPMIKLPLPEVGAKYKVSWMGDSRFRTTGGGHFYVADARGDWLCNAVSTRGCGHEYDSSWFIYSFDGSDSFCSTILWNCLGSTTVSLSRSILVIELV